VTLPASLSSGHSSSSSTSCIISNSGQPSTSTQDHQNIGQDSPMNSTTSTNTVSPLLPSAAATQPTRSRPTVQGFRRINVQHNARFKSQHFLAENLKLQKAQLAIGKQKLPVQKRKAAALESIDKHVALLPNAIEALERELSIMRQVYLAVNKAEVEIEP
jgi:hypothetical protein